MLTSPFHGERISFALQCNRACMQDIAGYFVVAARKCLAPTGLIWKTNMAAFALILGVTMAALKTLIGQ